MALYQDHLEVPKEVMKEDRGFSIDFGGSLIKVAYVNEGHEIKPKNGHLKIHVAMFVNHDLDKALEFLKEKACVKPGGTYIATGLGAAKHKKKIEKFLNVKVTVVSEFECIARTIRLLKNNFSEDDYIYSSQQDKDEAEQAKETSQTMAVVNTIGQGQTNIVESDKCQEESEMLFVMGSAGLLLKMNPDGTNTFVSGITNCGLTLLGMGRLLTEAESFKELIALASKGNYENIHQCGKDVQPKKGEEESIYSHVPDNMIIYQFAKACKKSKGEFKKEDLALALVTSMVANLAQICCSVCNVHKVKRVYVCGGMSCSELVRKRFSYAWSTQLITEEPVDMKFVKYGGYLGALGALFRD